MKKTNNFNLLKQNEQYKQKAQYLTSNKNYRDVINCYEKIAKNIKIEKKSEKDAKSKFLLKSKVKRIKKLIKNLKIIINTLDESFSADVHYLFKDYQDNYYWFEVLSLDEEEDIEYEDVSRTREDESISAKEETPKKNCYKCKRETTLLELKIANPSMDGAYLQKLFDSPFIQFYCCDCFKNFMKLPPEVWIESIVSLLLRCEEGVEYKIDDLSFVKSGVHDWDEVLFHLEKIELIKRTGENLCIDPEDKENDEKLHQFVLNRAPLIEIIDAHSFVVTDSPFYRALNDGQKALFYVSNNPHIKYPYYDIKIPDKYKTREFLEYENVYYVNNRFSLTQKSIKMMLKIGHLISQLCNYTNDISLEDVIEQLHDPIPID